MKITNNQKKYLRALAHNLKPVITVGKQGLNDAVLLELKHSMQSHELLKIKVRNTNREERKDIIDKIISYADASVVQIIGSSLTIYKTFTQKPVILLPRK